MIGTGIGMMMMPAGGTKIARLVEKDDWNNRVGRPVGVNPTSPACRRCLCGRRRASSQPAPEPLRESSNFRGRRRASSPASSVPCRESFNL